MTDVGASDDRGLTAVSAPLQLRPQSTRASPVGRRGTAIEVLVSMRTRLLPRVLTTAFALSALVGVSQRAQAFEATNSGVSVSAGVERFIDATVTTSSGDPVDKMGGHVGASILGNLGDMALGAVVAGRPDILGDGRLMVGGRAGWQPTFGTTRVQLLGDVGMHRFTNVEAGLFSSTTPNLITTPYVGFQVGMTRSFIRGGHLEYGLALVGRHDLRQQSAVHHESAGIGLPIAHATTTSTAPPDTELRVGGTMIGVSLTVGVRFEKARRADSQGARAAIEAVDAP